MLHKRVKQLYQELELPVDVDPDEQTLSLPVGERLSMDFHPRGDTGYTFRIELGRVGDIDVEEFYVEAMQNNLFHEEVGGHILSLNGEDKTYLTFSREMDLGYAQFAEDFESFLNKVDYWSDRLAQRL